MEKVILTTGGTGGHIFPALAVAEELRKRNPAIDILFMGSFYGPEADLAQKWNIPFKGFNVRGFLGRGVKSIPASWKMFMAMLEAFQHIRGYEPDIVAGFGGYASFAPVFAAKILRKPILLHEQNAIAGSGNRFLGHLADTVCVTVPNTEGFGKNVSETGNPVRKVFNEVYEKRRGKTAKGKKLLVIGGSQGAHALNRFISDNLESFREAGVTIRHQTGERDLAATRECYLSKGLDASCVSAFIDDMAGAYEWADVILCRAGASTIAELCACGLPAIFVPFPAAIHDHQTKNAKAVVKNGGGIMVPESELQDEVSLKRILELLNNTSLQCQMGEATRKMARMNAASLLVDRMADTVAKRKSEKRHV